MPKSPIRKCLRLARPIPPLWMSLMAVANDCPPKSLPPPISLVELAAGGPFSVYLTRYWLPAWLPHVSLEHLRVKRGNPSLPHCFGVRTACHAKTGPRVWHPSRFGLLSLGPPTRLEHRLQQLLPMCPNLQQAPKRRAQVPKRWDRQLSGRWGPADPPRFAMEHHRLRLSRRLQYLALCKSWSAGGFQTGCSRLAFSRGLCDLIPIRLRSYSTADSAHPNLRSRLYSRMCWLVRTSRRLVWALWKLWVPKVWTDLGFLPHGFARLGGPCFPNYWQMHWPSHLQSSACTRSTVADCRARSVAGCHYSRNCRAGLKPTNQPTLCYVRHLPKGQCPSLYSRSRLSTHLPIRRHQEPKP